MTLVQKTFGFQGRMRRRDYWVIAIVTGIGLAIIGMIINAALGHDLSTPFGPGDLIVLIPNLWISLALMMKRTHDRDKSGWWLLFYILVPVVGWIWSLVELGFLDGTQGPNRFGASPKGIGEDVDVFD